MTIVRKLSHDARGHRYGLPASDWADNLILIFNKNKNA